MQQHYNCSDYSYMMHMNNTQARYEQVAMELQETHQRFQLDIETLKARNRELQVSQEKSYTNLCKENHTMLKKQTKLYEEMEELREMQKEATAVCQQYEEALNETKKLLVKEQRHRAKLVSENKSLETQLGFASQKLRDLEKTKNSRVSLPRSLSRQSSRFGRSHVPSTISSYEPRTNEEEFYSHLQDEFDSTTGSIPFEFEDPPSDDGLTFKSSSTITKTNPRRATLHVSAFSSWTSRSQLGTSSLAMIREDKEEESAEDNKGRVSELQRRNAKALPHLKSSYPIEMQVQPESPSLSDDCVKNATVQGQGPLTSTTRRPAASQMTSKQGPPCAEMRPGRKRTISSRKKAEGFLQPPPFDPLMTSPLPTRRRISSSPIQEDILPCRPETRHFTMAPTGVKLREYLDHKPISEPDPRRQSTTFDITFSPPRAKVSLPKRLQQQKENKTNKTTVSKPSATVTKSRPAQNRKTVLKSKN